MMALWHVLLLLSVIASVTLLCIGLAQLHVQRQTIIIVARILLQPMMAGLRKRTHSRCGMYSTHKMKHVHDFDFQTGALKRWQQVSLKSSIYKLESFHWQPPRIRRALRTLCARTAVEQLAGKLSSRLQRE
jgi:hypothetical protein